MRRSRNEYVIPIDPPEDQIESYEIDDQNMALVRVDGLSTGPIVTLQLSRDAMLGLATELIRSAHRNDGLSSELSPAVKGLASQCLGIYLHPQSCRLNIQRVEMGTVEAALLAEGT